MPFISELYKYRSVSVVGLEKNTGKTETLNYIIGKLELDNHTTAVTSIGIDGEGLDQVTQTSKPEITLQEGMYFTTSEKHYQQRMLTSEIVNVSNHSTALGRLVTALVKVPGKVMLSGPSDTANLQRLLKEHEALNIQLTLVDGALSRMSLASPTVTEAMVLATGAAYSANMNQLIKQTKFMCDLISLPRSNEAVVPPTLSYDKGIWAIDSDNEWHKLAIPSALMFDKYKELLFQKGRRLYIGGVVSDKFIQYLTLQLKQGGITLVVRDFTKLFITPQHYHAFLKMGGVIEVLYQTQLIAVTVNPTSPQGYQLDSNELCKKLSEAIALPVYNVKELDL